MVRDTHKLCETCPVGYANEADKIRSSADPARRATRPVALARRKVATYKRTPRALRGVLCAWETPGALDCYSMASFIPPAPGKRSRALKRLLVVDTQFRLVSARRVFRHVFRSRHVAPQLAQVRNERGQVVLHIPRQRYVYRFRADYQRVNLNGQVNGHAGGREVLTIPI